MADAPASWAGLREHCPVAWSERQSAFWVVSRYDDAVELARRADLFDSSGAPLPLAGEPARTTFSRGVSHLPVRLDARA